MNAVNDFDFLVAESTEESEKLNTKTRSIARLIRLFSHIEKQSEPLLLGSPRQSCWFTLHDDHVNQIESLKESINVSKFVFLFALTIVSIWFLLMPFGSNRLFHRNYS